MTLADLQRRFPGYTSNELYAIWSHLNGLIPLDKNGKVDVGAWQKTATRDGRFVQEGGFRVSRALYGRAKRAKEGVTKPPRRVQARSSPRADPSSSGLSPQALVFAQRYDEAAKTISRVVSLRREIHDLLLGLKDVDEPVAQGLAQASQEAKVILDEARSL